MIANIVNFAIVSKRFQEDEGKWEEEIEENMKKFKWLIQ